MSALPPATLRDALGRAPVMSEVSDALFRAVRELADPERLRRAFADGNVPTVILIEDAGHFVQNEAPERVNAELLRWLGPVV